MAADAFIFEDQHKTPLGVNMAVRRSLIERIGGFRPDLGRNGKALLGQEQAEFFYRSRAAGARGLYVPDMVLDHVVPASAPHAQLLPPLVVLEGRVARARAPDARLAPSSDIDVAPRPAGARRPALRLRQHRLRNGRHGCADGCGRTPRSAPSTGSRSPTTPATAARSGAPRRSGETRAVPTKPVTGRRPRRRTQSRPCSDSPARRLVRHTGGRLKSRRCCRWSRLLHFKRRHHRAMVRRRHAAGVAHVEHLRGLDRRAARAFRQPHVVDAAVAGVAGIVADTPPPCRALRRRPGVDVGRWSCSQISAAPGQALKSPAWMRCCEKLDGPALELAHLRGAAGAESASRWVENTLTRMPLTRIWTRATERE